MADSFPQRRHLHRGQRRLKSLIPHLQPGAINSLLEVLAGKHAKRVRDPGLLRRLSNAARDFIHDYVIVRGVPSEQAAEADNRVIFPGLC